MRKIFEFKVYNMMKDDEIYNFLKRVKFENPDKYNKFVSIVGNKGLDVAKEKYKEYDPEKIKERKKKEKKRRKPKK